MRTLGLVIALTLAALAAPATASASLADEQRAGQELAAQLRSGATSCERLSAEDFDHIGEYVMGSVLGNVRAHQAMNDRMTAMLGSQGEQRMHELMGRRYAGCLDAAGASGGGWMMGAGGAGTGMMAADRHGWSALGIVAVTLGGVALAVLPAMGAVALNRRSRRTPPAAAAP